MGRDMQNIITVNSSVYQIKTYIYDLLVVLFIYLVPTVSHLLSFPLYVFDPMKIVVILALIHTNRKNAYVIAPTLPLFSFLVASHPVALKSLLITAELTLNIWLFLQLSKFISDSFLAMFKSIVFVKFFYYSIKYVLVSTDLLTGSLVDTSLFIRLTVALVISIYCYILFRKKCS